MTRNYNLRHRLIAHILLFSLFLQSCGNSIIPSNNVQKGEQVYDKQASIREERDDKSQSLSALQQDHQITIYQQGVEVDYMTRGALLKATEDQNTELGYQSEREGKKYWLDGVASQKHLLAIPLLCAATRIKTFNKSIISPFYLSTHSKKHSLWSAHQSITRGKSRFLASKSEAMLPYNGNEYSFSLMQKLNASRLLEEQYREKEVVQSSFRLPVVTLISLGVGGIELVVEDESDEDAKKEPLCEKEIDQEFVYSKPVKHRLYNLLEQPRRDSAINQKFKKVLKALKNNDPHVKIIDLRQEQLQKKQFEALKRALDKNFVVGYIEWGEVPTDCQELKKEIDKKLVQNICSYTYHPSDYVHGLLASHIYKEPKEGEQDFNDINKEDDGSEKKEALKLPLPPNMNRDWKVVQFEDDSKKSGFYSALYVNETTHQAVLSFQGTKYLLKDLFVEDMQGVLGNAITRQQTLAYKATKAAVEYVKEKGFNLSITGHSLGGYLAELGVAFCYLDFDYKQAKGVVFDSPGTDTKLNTFKSNVKNQSTKFAINKLPITTYLSVPNFVNVCHGHVGEVYRLYPDLKGPGWLDKWTQRASTLPVVGKKLDTAHQGLLSIAGHSLDLMLALFNAATGKPQEYARVGDWPRLHTEALEHVGKEGSAGDLIGGALGGGVGRLVGSMVLGNLGTLGSVATVIADCRNVDQTQFWTTHSYLDGYREVGLEPTEEYKQKYKSHYRVSPISIDLHPLCMDGYENIDGFLYALWKDRKAINQLKTNDIIGAVLKNILQDYTVVTIEDKPCLQLKQNPTQIQVLRDKMQRAKEVLTPDRINEALKYSNDQAVCNYVEQELRNQFQEEQLKKLRRLHSYLPVAKLAGYLSREDKEKELAQKLEEKGICVVYGHGGVGKSTLVAEYGHKLKDQQIVCWTQAETADKLITSYENAAREIGISEEQLAYLKKEAGSNYLAVLAREVYKYIEKSDHQEPPLLILDNATDPSLIADCLLHKPAWVKVIITTRDGKNFKDYSQIKLGPFTKKEGKAYIQHSLLSLNPSEKDIEALIEEVGLIPQKLSLATGYIREVRFMNVEKYIQKLQELKEKHERQQGKLVLPEVNLGLETLEPQSQLLMRYNAYLDPDFIPSSLIKILLSVNEEEELAVLLSPIEKLSLVTIIDDSRQTGIQIHREVQVACKDYQEWKGENKVSEQDLMLSILEALNEHMPNVTGVPDSTWDQARIYASSVAHVLTNSGKELAAQPLLASLLNRMGYYNQEIQCNYEQALKYYQQALEMRQALYTGNHPAVASSLNNIGMVYHDLGKYQEALKYLVQALEMKQALYTGNHPGIANLLNGIGYAYLNLGQHQEALKYYERALEMRKVLYTGNHRDIGSSLYALGGIYQHLGKCQEALEYHQQAFEIAQSLYPGNNPDIAKSLDALGGIYQDLGKYQEALEYHQQAFEMRQALYTGNHPDIAASLNNIGGVYSALGQLEEALKYYEQASKIWQAVYTGNHPNIAASLNNIGTVYSDLDQHQEALKYYEQALEMRQTLYTGNHHDVASLLNDIGTVYSKLGQLEEALKYYEQALEMRKALYTGNHPHIASTLNKLGNIYQDLRQYDEALKCYEQALAIWQTVYLGIHPYIAGLLHNHGCVYLRLGQSQEALKYHKQALEIRKTLHKGNHPDVASSLNNIGNVYYSLGEHKEALKYYKQALEMRRILYKDNPPHIAKSLRNLGLVYLKLGQYSEALKHYQQALEIWQALHAGNHPHIARSLGNIGTVYKDLGQHQEALKYYGQAIQMFKALYPDNFNHSDIQIIKENIEKLKKKQGKEK